MVGNQVTLAAQRPWGPDHPTLPRYWVGPGGADTTRLAPNAPTTGDNNACGCDTRVGHPRLGWAGLRSRSVDDGIFLQAEANLEWPMMVTSPRRPGPGARRRWPACCRTLIAAPAA